MKKGSVRVKAQDSLPAVFLALCIVLGGASAAGAMANGVLQLVAIVVLGYVGIARPVPWVPASRALVVGLAAFGAWLLLQSLPLPPVFWTRLPGRAIVVSGFATSGSAPGWEPLSLAPDATVATLLALLPPSAMAVLTLAATDRARRIAIGTLVTLAIGAALLGVVQVLAGPGSAFYPYDLTNPGKAVGPFANRNHLATLLLCAIAVLGTSVQHNGPRRSAAALSGVAVLAGGVIMTGSDAGLLMLAVLLTFLVTRVSTGHSAREATLSLLVAAVLLASVAGIASLWQGSSNTGAGAEQRRGVTIPRTFAAAIDHLPFGAGGGSFPTIYPAYTDPALASPAFVNHAHCDYAEMLLDHGVVGLLLIGAAWGWWGLRVRTGWTTDPVVRAALVMVAICLIHSLVDYPLRTATLATVAAFAAALATGQPPAVAEKHRRSRASRQLSATFDLS
ncbi:O-antigen ligase family protein [Sphingomonas sp. PP-CC-3G-468]|uniref:O-antigen ligase family protein n=1 Tax=Sphingomonas sp. PP-CC-3G-468 TaxID=2135656 RepID=UPI0010E9AF3D|nr:O-antigen ligase family protein [Sphingomonas sp. PP-CC-3G-468]TCM07509.1 O-antigen ligase-like membrane protein [Sphingomonas sp. PP-CC-3G-468]